MAMGISQRKREKRGVPEGLWLSCPSCKSTLYRKDVERRQNVCPTCDHHFYIGAYDRIRHLLDQESFEEWFTNLNPTDPLNFVDLKAYKDRLNG